MALSSSHDRRWDDRERRHLATVQAVGGSATMSVKSAMMASGFKVFILRWCRRVGRHALKCNRWKAMEVMGDILLVSLVIFLISICQQEMEAMIQSINIEFMSGSICTLMEVTLLWACASAGNLACVNLSRLLELVVAQRFGGFGTDQLIHHGGYSAWYLRPADSATSPSWWLVRPA